MERRPQGIALVDYVHNGHYVLHFYFYHSFIYTNIIVFTTYRMEGPQRIALVEPRASRGLLPPSRIGEDLLGRDLKLLLIYFYKNRISIFRQANLKLQECSKLKSFRCVSRAAEKLSVISIPIQEYI